MPRINSRRTIRNTGRRARKHTFPGRPYDISPMPAAAPAAGKTHFLITRLAVDDRLSRIFFAHLKSQLVRHSKIVMIVPALIKQQIQPVSQPFWDIRIPALDMGREKTIRRQLL